MSRAIGGHEGQQVELVGEVRPSRAPHGTGCSAGWQRSLGDLVRRRLSWRWRDPRRWALLRSGWTAVGGRTARPRAREERGASPHAACHVSFLGRPSAAKSFAAGFSFRFRLRETSRPAPWLPPKRTAANPRKQSGSRQARAVVSCIVADEGAIPSRADGPRREAPPLVFDWGSAFAEFCRTSTRRGWSKGEPLLQPLLTTPFVAFSSRPPPLRRARPRATCRTEFALPAGGQPRLAHPLDGAPSAPRQPVATW